jgi:uncharacterized protein YyaL (SSP411 family)
MIGGLAKAYQAFQDDDLYSRAVKTADFVRDQLYLPNAPGGSVLLRNYRDAPSQVHGTNEDYAFLIQGLLELYQCRFEDRFIQWANELQRRQLELFFDREHGAFFSSPDPTILLKLKDDHDGAEPSSNSVSVANLIKLGTVLDNQDYMDKAKQTLSVFYDRLMSFPHSMPHLTASLCFYQHPLKVAVFVGKVDSPKTRDLITALQSTYTPSVFPVLASPGTTTGFMVEHSANVKSVVENASTNDQSVHICQGQTCGLPIREPNTLLKQISC